MGLPDSGLGVRSSCGLGHVMTGLENALLGDSGVQVPHATARAVAAILFLFHSSSEPCQQREARPLKDAKKSRGRSFIFDRLYLYSSGSRRVPSCFYAHPRPSLSVLGHGSTEHVTISSSARDSAASLTNMLGSTQGGQRHGDGGLGDPPHVKKEIPGMPEGRGGRQLQPVCVTGEALLQRGSIAVCGQHPPARPPIFSTSPSGRRRRGCSRVEARVVCGVRLCLLCSSRSFPAGTAQALF